jgi:hypothetical protein
MWRPTYRPTQRSDREARNTSRDCFPRARPYRGTRERRLWRDPCWCWSWRNIAEQVSATRSLRVFDTVSDRVLSRVPLEQILKIADTEEIEHAPSAALDLFSDGIVHVSPLSCGSIAARCPGSPGRRREANYVFGHTRLTTENGLLSSFYFKFITIDSYHLPVSLYHSLFRDNSLDWNTC